MKKAFIISSVILILLFLAAYFVKPGAEGMKIPLRPDSQQENTAALCRQIEEAEKKYNADCQELLSEFLPDLEKRTAPDFEKADRAVPGVVKELCSFKVCVKLCCKAVKDKIKGTHDFLDAYTAAMDAPIIRPCVHANLVASDMLQNLQLRLKERHARYLTDLATICSNDASDVKLPPKDLEKLQNCLETVAGTVQTTYLKKVMAGIGTAFEVVFIRESCGYIVKLFAKPVAKICASAGAAGICAAADGPLPLGDIAGALISIGGLSWTVWDIYDVMYVMPKKLNAELRNGIASTKAKLLEESRKQAEKIVQAYRESGCRINQELKEQLK